MGRMLEYGIVSCKGVGRQGRWSLLNDELTINRIKEPLGTGASVLVLDTLLTISRTRR
jgi:hypothetical protein